jgi:hypothetical protein
VDFDHEVKQPQFEQLLHGDRANIPVRELMIRSSLCRSIMELGQKNINFGFLDKNEPRTKTIVIRNKSEAPLMYAIRKSGSISSGDLMLGEGRIGLIRSYGHREVDFVFDPSLSGPFYEKLTVENIHDRDSDQLLTIKANVRQPTKFSIKNLNLDFGACLIKETAPRSQVIEISNTSAKQSRTFQIRVDTEKLKFRGCLVELRFELEDEDMDQLIEASQQVDNSSDMGGRRLRRPTTLLSKEAEEQIEALEQKVKIARRKGRPDKVQKLLDKLDNLRSGSTSKEEKTRTPDLSDADTELLRALPGEGTSAASPVTDTCPVVDSFKMPSKSLDAPKITKLRKKDNSIVFSLEPRAIKRILVSLRAVPTPANLLKWPTGDKDILVSV